MAVSSGSLRRRTAVGKRSLMVSVLGTKWLLLLLAATVLFLILTVSTLGARDVLVAFRLLMALLVLPLVALSLPWSSVALPCSKPSPLGKKNARNRAQGLGSLIVLFALQDFLLALGGSHVLDTNMNALFNDSTIHQLVDTNSHSRLGHIENNSRSSVVSLVGHTLVNGRIGKNIHIVTDLDLHQVLRQVDGATLSELLGEHVARTRPNTIRVRHVAFGLHTSLF